MLKLTLILLMVLFLMNDRQYGNAYASNITISNSNLN